MSEEKQEIQTRKAPTTLREMIKDDRFQSSINDALPAGFEVTRFIAQCKTMAIKSPKLSDCTVESMSKCLLDCASLGLYPDGRLAHLIPYKDQCTLILDYKGLVELVMRSGEVKNIHSDVVCDNDDFSFNMGKIVKHEIDFKNPRGDVYAVYSMAEKKDGSFQCQVMTKDEVEKVRQSSRGKNSSPWMHHWNEMAKKTVFRRLSKWLPICTDAAPKLAEIEQDEFKKEDPVFDMPQD